MQIGDKHSCYQLRDYYEAHPVNEEEYAKAQALHVEREEKQEEHKKEKIDIALSINKYMHIKENVLQVIESNHILKSLKHIQKEEKIVRANIIYKENQNGIKVSFS